MNYAPDFGKLFSFAKLGKALQPIDGYSIPAGTTTKPRAVHFPVADAHFTDIANHVVAIRDL